MHVYGTLKDATEERRIARAKTGPYIGEKELPVLYSDVEKVRI